MPLMLHIKPLVKTHKLLALLLSPLHLGLDQEIVLFSGSHPSYLGWSQEAVLGVYTGATQGPK